MLVFVLWFVDINFKNMLMPLQIFKVFYIFVLYFQVVLSNMWNPLVATHFYGSRHKHVIFISPFPLGANPRNPYLHGSTASGLKGSRHQDALPSSRYTTQPPLNLPLAWLKILVPPKIAHSYIVSHWSFFVTLTLDMPFCTSQQTKTILGATHTTQSSSSFVKVLKTQICPIWILCA